MKAHLPRSTYAVGSAIALLLAAPAAFAESSWWSSVRERVAASPFVPPKTPLNVMNGNDFRDNRDSTIMRNDVPVNQTGLWRDAPPSVRFWQDGQHARGTAQGEHPGSGDRPGTWAASSEVLSLPATAVREVGKGSGDAPAMDFPEPARQAEAIRPHPPSGAVVVRNASGTHVVGSAAGLPVQSSVPTDAVRTALPPNPADAPLDATAEAEPFVSR